MVSLDIEGLRQRVVAGFTKPTARPQMPRNLYGMVMGYLRDREGPRCIRSGVRGRRGPDVFRTVSLSTGGDQQGTSPCEGLGRSNKLRFAPSKTNAMVLTRKLKFDVPVIRMGNTLLTRSASVFRQGVDFHTPAKACKRLPAFIKA
ncbi:hypothetical protein EVAR_40301_1 [Eumeta japonica]|uniref:Uncharacterized protein n=1 Tax=Eumeta variegata TaxID=151549 RepID=A0A4C1YCP5_EUMVA|nr:hypothetical protein EVAR_40301_1 [Eumeta japonica]